MKPKPFILFDLDGTLVDSSGWLLTAVNRVLAPYLKAPWTLSDLVATAGAPERTVIGRIVPSGELDSVLSAYRSALSEAGSLRIQPGIETLLAALDAEGYATGLFSGAGRDLGELRLRLAGWEHRFPVRVWGDEAEPKPSPAGIHLALKRAAMEASSATYIGDTQKDLLCARAAGVRFLGAGWGDEPAGLTGAWVAVTPAELLARIQPD